MFGSASIYLVGSFYIYTTTTIRSRWYRVAASGAMFLRGLGSFFPISSLGGEKKILLGSRQTLLQF